MTSKERVHQALDKAYEMAESIKEAEEKARASRIAYNELRAMQNQDALEQERDTSVKEVTSQAEAVYEGEMSQATVKLERAQNVHEKECARAKDTRDSTVESVTREWDEKVAEARRVLDLEAAEAQAEAHTAEQGVAQLKASLERYEKQVQQQLGIDLSSLIKAGE